MLRCTDILIIIEAEIATTHLIEQILSACKLHGIRYRVQRLLQLTPADLSPHVMPLIVRSCDPMLIQWIEILTAANQPYLYYIDDNFWEIEGSPELAAYYQHPLVRHTLNTAITQAHTVITNSHFLREFITRLNTNVKLLPAFFDFDLIESIEPPQTKEIRIGFAGSASRQVDLEIMKPVIEKMLTWDSRIIFEFAGVMPLGVAPGSRIRFFPHQDNYRSFIQFKAGRGWKIGLAPLRDTAANRCKTDNKYREYAACGIAGIYSKVQPYVDSVAHGITGILVDNDVKSWEQALMKLVSTPSLCATISESAQADVRQRYCVRQVASEWAEFLKATDNECRRRGKRIALKPPSMWMTTLAKLRRTRLLVTTVYQLGGLRLVLRKLARRILLNIKSAATKK